MKRYVVASKDHSEFRSRSYYIDTRGQFGYDDSSDIFTSSSCTATFYDSKEKAEAWNKEFLQGEGEVVELHSTEN